MCRRSKFFGAALFMVLALIGSPPSAQATPLAPGATVAPSTFAPGDFGALAPGGVITAPFVGINGLGQVRFQGTLVENVVTDTVTGNLDFLYQIQRVPGVGIDDIRRMTTSSYDIFTLDV